MNSRKDEFNDELNAENIENELLRRAFVSPLIFPGVKEWTGKHILYIGNKGENTRPVSLKLEEEFPGAIVRSVDTDSLNDPKKTEEEGYNYIVFPGLKRAGKDFRRIFERTLERLTNEGVVAGSVYGYTGYYGLHILRTIVLSLCSDIIEIKPDRSREIIDSKNFPKVSRIISAVLERLPANHPALESQAFIEKLKKGAKETISELIRLSEDRLFSVPRLLREIEESGGQFMGWVKPELYDPGRYTENIEIHSRLKTLSIPYRWKIAELVNAHPPVHYFFAKKIK